MGLKQDVVIVNEFSIPVPSGKKGRKGTRGGTPGDYVSFDSWEWPQGVGLYGLVRLWAQTGDERLLKTVESWYDRRIAAGLPAMNVNTTAPLLADHIAALALSAPSPLPATCAALVSPGRFQA